MVFSLISLMVCLLAGFIGRFARIINDGAITALTDILINICFPCTIFLAMIRPFSLELLSESLFVLGAFAAVQGMGLLFGFVAVNLLRVNPEEKRIWIFASGFANNGNMGYPVIGAVFGSSALIYASMTTVSFNLMAYTIGIRLIDSSQRNTKYDWRRIFFTPVMASTVLGLICFGVSLSLPEPASNGIQYIANMTTPVSMLLLGAILAKSDFRGLFGGWKVYAVLLVKHFILPLTALALFKPLIHNHTVLSVIVVLSAMPSASMTAILAQKYNGDSNSAARIVFISTVLSLVTVPVISLFL